MRVNERIYGRGGWVKSSRHLYWKLKKADTPNNFLLLTVENNATTMILSLSLSEHGFPPCQLVCAIANKKPAIWGRMELIFTHCLCFWFSTRTFFRIVHLFRRRLYHMKALHANCYRFLFLCVLSLYPIALNREDNVSHCKFKPLFFRWPSTVSTAMCRRFKGTNLRVEQQWPVLI